MGTSHGGYIEQRGGRKELGDCRYVSTILFDQELTYLCILIFLENNQGKDECAVIFGQLQKRRNKTVVSKDGMFALFEDIRKRASSLTLLDIFIS